MKSIKFVPFLIICIVLSSGLTACDNSDKDTVLTVNGVAVPLQEYNIVTNTLRSDVLLYYTENYGETDFGDSFWKRSYGENEKTPAEMLQEKTHDKLTENHMILSWAKEKNLIADDSYSGILKAMATENADRAEKLQDGEVIYGVSQFTAEEYYDYAISNCSVGLRNIISQALSDTEMEEFYRENKAELYEVPAVFECKQVIVSGDITDARTKADRVIQLINNGTDIESAATAENLTVSEESYDLSLIRTLSIRLPSVSAALYEMEQGDIRLIEEFSDYYILQIVSKSQGEYIAFEDALADIQSALALQKFDEKIAEMVKKAKVSVKKGL